MHARIWIIPPLLALAAFCCYGVLATYEPPGYPTLRIVYLAGITLALATCIVTWIKTRRPKD